VGNAYKCILHGRDRHSLPFHHILSKRESERLAEGEARGSSVDSQRVAPVRGRGWGAGGVAGGPSQRGMCAFISRARTPYRNPWGMVAESSCVRCFPNVQTRTWHGPQWPRRCVSNTGGNQAHLGVSFPSRIFPLPTV
jgi:hypothetical protein